MRRRPEPTSAITIVLLTALVAIGPLSTDMYLPSLPQMIEALAADVGTVQLTLSVFLAAFAIAQLAYGPLSDRYGRRPVLLAGIAIYVVASLGCALATSIEHLIAARCLQALGVCACPVIARAVIRDVFADERGARALAYLGTAMAVAPLIAPSIGGQLAAHFGWRSNFVALAAYAGLLLMLAAALLPETHARRDPAALRFTRMVDTYRVLLLSRRFVTLMLANACVFSGLFAFISGSSFVFIDFLGVPVEWFGACFAVAIAGYITGTFFTGRMVARIGIPTMLLGGALIAATASAVLATLAWTRVDTIAAILAPMFGYMVGTGVVMPTAMSAAIHPFPRSAGAASALLGFVQMTLAALAGFLVGQLDDGTQVPMTTATAAMGFGTIVAAAFAVRTR